MHNLVWLFVISLLFGISSAAAQDNRSSALNVYQVDAESSDVRLLTYRGGILSKLGHSHVISVGQLTGKVYVHGDIEQSNLELEIPVRELIVDDPRLRAEEGDEFSSVPTERDIADTRKNMLGKRVLNADEYPTIKVTGSGPKSGAAGSELELAIELLGRVVELSVPTTVHLEGEELKATGAIRLSHSDLGMRPFSAMLGSLRVAEHMDLKYDVRAVRTPSSTAITNVTVIDAVNGVRENQDVVFDGDKIIAVRPSEPDISAARVIDGKGKFLIPGLWDMHVHLTFDDRFTDTMPALFLSYGITSVRDTGGLMHKIVPVVESMRADDALAPRVFFAGPLLDGHFVVYDGGDRPEIGVQNSTPADAQNTIRKLKEQGVDFIKIYELVNPAVFRAMVDTANALELPIDSHVPLSMKASIAGPSVDSMEHLRNVEMDCASDAEDLHEKRLKRLKNPDGQSGYQLRLSLHTLQRLPAIANHDAERCDNTIRALTSTLQVPTLRLLLAGYGGPTPLTRTDWDDAVSRVPDEVAAEWQDAAAEWRANPPQVVDSTYADWALSMTRRMHEAGVPIGAGTDTPLVFAIPGYSLHSELEFLVAAGLTPIDALASATVRPAEFFSLQDEMGTIDIGKKADLVLLNANPLENIKNTKLIEAVVTKGEFLSGNALWQPVQRD